MSSRTGVLLMTFGSATTAGGVREYLASVRGGRPVPEDLVAEFERRYRLVGRSPLIDITEAQAAALQQLLRSRDEHDATCVVAGMLHSAPRIAESVQQLLDQGVTRIVAVPLAPQYSSIVLAGYERAVAAVREAHPALDIRVAGAWHRVPEWIDSLAERVDTALRELPPQERDRIPIIFTAHSLPKQVVDRDPAYIEQLRETARDVAERVGLATARWQFAYQSAGHTPEEWLRPDVKELLPALRDSGHTSVLVVPVQFLADHLEILYDIDIAAVQEADALGVQLRRVALPNSSPALIRALAAVVDRELA
jgi:protoporphyrin/coproporphyrin ferrochelatase